MVKQRLGRQEIRDIGIFLFIFTSIDVVSTRILGCEYNLYEMHFLQHSPSPGAFCFWRRTQAT